MLYGLDEFIVNLGQGHKKEKVKKSYTQMLEIFLGLKYLFFYFYFTFVLMFFFKYVFLIHHISHFISNF